MMLVFSAQEPEEGNQVESNELVVVGEVVAAEPAVDPKAAMGRVAVKGFGGLA